MSYSGTNQWGPYTSNNATDAVFPNYAPPEGTATPTPTTSLTVAQSPSGSVTNEASTWEFANTELAVENLTSALVSAAHAGVAFNFQGTVTPGTAPYGAVVGNKADVQTTPSAPSGSYVQQGITWLTHAAVVADQPYNLSSRNIVNLG